MVTKKANGSEGTASVEVEGTTYVLRRVKVKEADAAFDAAELPGSDGTKWNGRLNGRLLLAASIVSPETTIDEMEDWTNYKLGILLRAYDELNRLPSLPNAEGGSPAA